MKNTFYLYLININGGGGGESSIFNIFAAIFYIVLILI